MKKIIYLLIAAACALPVAGCSELDIDMDTNGGKGLEFVHFLSSSGSILSEKDKPESHKFTTTVSVTGLSSEARTFNVKIGDETTGVEGTNFTMTSKTVTIPANKYTGTISFDIDYDNLGEAGFKVELLLDVDVNSLSPAFGNACLVTVKSDKVTIDWDWLLGAWSALDINPDGTPDGSSYSVQISRPDESSNGIVISNLWGSGKDLNATADLEARTITIATGQTIFTQAPYGDFTVCAFNLTTEEGDADVPAMGEMSAFGVSIGPWCMINPAGFWAAYDHTMFTR